MRILIVCSYKIQYTNSIAPFIQEQAEMLQQKGMDVDFFLIKGKGITGYLKERKNLLSKISSFHPDLIHAHFGLSGLLANLQRKVPVVTTYHGSDINLSSNYKFSRLAMFLSSYNIFVSSTNMLKSGLKKKVALLPCGVDLNLFYPRDKYTCRKKLGFREDEKLVLFSNAFWIKVKNADLAQHAIAEMSGVRLLELANYSREEVALLMNACDAALMTSFSEGSPQFIKEALACNCPVVSVDVGDVKSLISGVKNCSIVDYKVNDIVEKLGFILKENKRSDGRSRVLEMNLDNETIADKIISIYQKVIE